jgi:DHA1 family tetracycline resistance protein-like MFS transporter
MIGAAFGIGFIIGPMLGGILGHYGVRVPFFFAAGLALVNWLYGYFVLPESLSKEHRRKFEWKRANPFGTLANLKKYPIFIGLFISIFLLNIASHAVQSTWTFYTMIKFNWDERMVGYSLGFVGLIVGLVQGVLLRIIIPKLGQKRSIYVGFCMNLIGLLLFAFASQTWMMFAFMIPYGLGAIAGPAIQSTISGHVSPSEQGELQGALTSLVSLAAIIGPLIMTNTFYYFTSIKAPIYFPGAPMITGAIFSLSGIFLAYKTLRQEK